VVVTGDITVEEARRAVGLTFGALPRRPQQLHKVTADNDVRFPPGEDLPTTLKTSAPANQSIASIAWATHGFYANPVDDAGLSFLSSILRARLTDDVRGQGLSYSVSVSQAASTGFDFGYLSASATMPPGKAQLFYESVDRIIADLEDGHISADEFARSRLPILEEYRRAAQSNEYWSALLATGWDQNAKFERARNFHRLLENVTPADVMAVARKYLVPARRLKISAGA
jgi:zinc protease